MEKVYVPGSGPLGAKLMILGEAPSYQEVAQGRPFVGPSGRELDRLLRDASINRQDCWLTNVSKFEVMLNPRDGRPIPFTVRAKLSGIDLHQQLIELQEEINSIQPNCILALGGTALWALSSKWKIGDYRGSILHGMGRKFVPTYHPAHLLHQAAGEFKGYWNKQVIVLDMKRAKKQAEFPELRLPTRSLSVCKNSAQLADFIDRHKDYNRPSVDIEALNCIPTCIGLAFTPHEGLSVPLWNKKGISNIPDSDLVSIWKLLATLLAESDVVGQNFKYDQDKISRLGFIIKRLASDTMLKAFCINPELPKNLAFNTSIYTEEPYYKNEGSEFDIQKQKIDDLFIYNARDACVTKELDLAMDPDLDELGLRPFYENFLMLLHPLYLEIENEGFRQHIPTRDKLLHKYIEWDEKLRYELFLLVGEIINTQSPKQVNLLLYENLKLPRKKTTGEEDLTALLKSPKINDDDRKIIDKILTNRRVRKTVGTYLMALPDYDGRMRTTYFLCNRTGRTSTGQQEPPIRPKIEVIDENGKKKKKNLGIAFQTITKHGDIGNDVRSMFIPDDGYIFLQADSSQAEARVVALLANDEEMLRMYDEHDVHAVTASWFFGGTESDYSKKILGYEVPQRFAGKTLRHAGHLGAGKRRAATELNTQARKYHIDLTITEAKAESALRIFHAKCPNIREVFHSEVIKCLEENNRMLIAPLPYGIDAPFGGKRIFYERWSDDLFRDAFSYIPQRAITDNTKAAALRIKRRVPSIKIILESHDSLLFAIERGRVREHAPIIREEMERPIDFSRCSLARHELSIPCDIEVGMDYQHLGKFKDVQEIVRS